MMLAAPLCEGVLSLLPQTTQGSDLDGWVDDVTLGDPFESLRAASLAMADADYRIMRVTVDLVPEARQGEMIISLPNHQSVTVSTPEIMIDGTWDRRMYAAVSQAPAALQAVLHKMHLTLGYVDGLQLVMSCRCRVPRLDRSDCLRQLMLWWERPDWASQQGCGPCAFRHRQSQSCVTYLRRSLPKSRVSTKFDLLSGQVAHAFRQVRIRQIGSL